MDAKKLMLMMDSKQYWQKIRALFGSSLIAYWPLWETSGTVAKDMSGNGNGTYSNVTLANKIGHNKKPVPQFNGSSSYVDIYSTALKNNFNGNSGTILQWVQIADLGTYTDGVRRYASQIFANASNYIFIYKSESDGTIVGRRIASSTSKLITYTASGNLGWIRVCLSWSTSPDELKFFVNGQKVGNTVTGNGSFSGDIDSNLCIIGAASKAPANQWSGWLSDTILLNRPITDTEALLDYSINP